MEYDITAPFIRAVTVANPVAQAQFTLTAPGSAAWRVLALTFRLVTDANAASRAVRLQADDGGNPWFIVGPETDQAATIDRVYCVVNGSHGFAGLSGLQPLPWPDTGLWLRPGWRLRTTTTNLQAGDQYSEISAVVQEYPVAKGTGWLSNVPYVSKIEG